MTDDIHLNAKVDRLDALANKMDNFLRIPGTSIRVGLDSILGLVPGVGDALALAPAGYIIAQSHRLGASKGTLARMGLNTGIDFVIGSIPLIGDIFDIGNKANRKNVALLRRHLDKKGVAVSRDPLPSDQMQA